MRSQPHLFSVAEFVLTGSMPWLALARVREASMEGLENLLVLLSTTAEEYSELSFQGFCESAC